MTQTRDPCSQNMMMDPTNVVPAGFHFGRHWTSDGIHDWTPRHRCQVAPVRYYFIDFEFSMWFPEPEKAQVTGRWGQIKTVPEMQKPEPYNPFKADVYQVGASFLMIFKVASFLISTVSSSIDLNGRTTKALTCSTPSSRE